MNPALSDAFSVIKVVFCSGVSCGIFLVENFDIKLGCEILEFLYDLGLWAQRVIEGVLRSGLHGCGHTAVREVRYLHLAAEVVRAAGALNQGGRPRQEGFHQHDY